MAVKKAVKKMRFYMAKTKLSSTNLVFILNKISPVFIKDVFSFAKIARGQRKKYHNW